MPKLISGYIPAQVAKYLGPHVLEATLTKFTPGAYNPAAVSAGTNPTATTYGASGFVKKYDGTLFPGTTIATDDVIVALLGATIEGGVVPEAQDEVTIEHPPESGAIVTYRVEAVAHDSVGAVYKLLARR